MVMKSGTVEASNPTVGGTETGAMLQDYENIFGPVRVCVRACAGARGRARACAGARGRARCVLRLPETGV